MSSYLIRHIDKLTEENKKKFKWCLILSWGLLFPFMIFVCLLISKIVLGKIRISVFFAWSGIFIIINLILNISWYLTFLKLSNGKSEFSTLFMWPDTISSAGLISTVVYYPLRFMFVFVATLLNVSKNVGAIVWLPIIISQIFGIY